MTSATISANASVTPSRAPTGTTPLDNLMDTLHRTGHFKHLMAAIKATGMAGTFNVAGPQTVFAPNDYAFGKLAKDVMSDLFKPQNKERLTALLRLHMVPRRVQAAAFEEKPAAFKSLQGEDLAVNQAQGLRV